ncbi:hypothetical protein [Sphingobacterium yanglingense]|uniref:Uncharacterized protein n=1 Tax=Sphingobacterium yanglingense TaxID=1437280 RepID=A0A4R6WJ00_9SPHI|nr:hypothetical protein [Sphingobacterium yanglingense]TDQ80134.1 hypothetical protein CLV99_1589 [Sphingobacterium yanglingense]
MAKQKSFIKMQGKVGDLSFSKSRTRGYEVRTPGGADKQRIMTDPNFQRTRENMAEFGSASSVAKLIRIQLNNLMMRFGDKTLRNRLTSVVHRIQKADSVSARGERVFKPENSLLLKGLEFNLNSSLTFMIGLNLPVTFDRVRGEVSLAIPAFNPRSTVTLLPGATHMRFTLAAVEQTLDPMEIPRPEVIETDYIPLIGDHQAETLTVNVPADSTKVIYMMIGIDMYQHVNEVYYPLMDNPYNTMSIVDVDIP